MLFNKPAQAVSALPLNLTKISPEFLDVKNSVSNVSNLLNKSIFNKLVIFPPTQVLRYPNKYVNPPCNDVKPTIAIGIHQPLFKCCSTNTASVKGLIANAITASIEPTGIANNKVNNARNQNGLMYGHIRL